MYLKALSPCGFSAFYLAGIVYYNHPLQLKPCKSICFTC
ncbi:hypothetical protein PNIG_a2701 [Pseudoalteromonas nigrifaciens]|uniref:Uncharacterized protein n=1 Tax=Pseudoalteromonas nigrifaciens TaxID=28109 RepID=A0AAC9UJ37_9GAMM|nr:hypothetical protein PNIG_a2701 [Pseudoalteromonas nigrifaciens]